MSWDLKSPIFDLVSVCNYGPEADFFSETGHSVNVCIDAK